MMIITIIVNITKITMMIRGETGGTHPHSSPVIRRPSKLSWHLTERTVTLCSQCDSVTLCSKFTMPLHTEHYSLHKTCHWHLTERSVTLSSKACTVDTAHSTLCTLLAAHKTLQTRKLSFYPRFCGGMLNTLDSWATAVLQKTNIFSTLVDRTMHYCTVGNTTFSIFCFHQNHSTVISYQAFMSKPWTVKYEFLESC